MIRAAILAGAVGLVAITVAPASAALVTFTGEDIMPTTSSPHPNSAMAAANFDASVTALGGGSLVTFENAALGSFSNLAIAPGVTMNGTSAGGANQTMRDTSNFPSFPTLDGYNTTPGGAEFVEVQGGTLTFSFSTPVQAFGAYFSGIQTNFFTDSITFSDGSSQTELIPGNGTTSSVGALSFVGFTDVGKSITSVTVNAGATTTGFDDIGVDDLRFQAASAAIAEPGSMSLLMPGLWVVLRYRQQRRSRT
jgi:hypothetical protein